MIKGQFVITVTGALYNKTVRENSAAPSYRLYGICLRQLHFSTYFDAI